MSTASVTRHLSKGPCARTEGQRWLKRKAALLVTPRECSRARKVGRRSIWRTPDHDRRAPLRRPETSFSQGAEWNALISKYIGTIPVSGDPCPAEQIISIGPPPRTPVMSAMIAKVGVAARHSHLAMPSAVITERSAGRACVIGLAHVFVPASRFRKAASPASDTSTHFASGEASAA